MASQLFDWRLTRWSSQACEEVHDCPPWIEKNHSIEVRKTELIGLFCSSSRLRQSLKSSGTYTEAQWSAGLLNVIQQCMFAGVNEEVQKNVKLLQRFL